MSACGALGNKMDSTPITVLRGLETEAIKNMPAV
jgi:hypothetical protein